MYVTIRILFVWLFLMVSECSGANILAIFLDPSKSHVIAYEPLTKALAARGHNVTVISQHPQTTPLKNYTDIYIPLEWFGLDMHLNSILNFKKERKTEALVDHLSTSGFNRCRYFLDTPGVQQLIHSSSPRFDLLILELYLHECFLGFTHKYNCSVVGIYVHGGTPNQYTSFGNVHPISYAPHINYVFTDRMSFTDRLRNAYYVLLDRLWRFRSEVDIYNNITMHYFREFSPLPSATELLKRFSLIFFNNDVSLNVPKPLLPNVMDIAGMHIKPPRKLDRELQEFLDGSKHGAILFSMGSHAGNFFNSEEKLRVFLDAFSELNQTVLWKSGPLTGVPPNVRLMDWLPQSDIVAHPNVLVFLTHGGLLGIEEALYNAKPIVGIPFHADQHFNMRRAQEVGYGIRLELANLTKEGLVWALNTVIQDPSYRNTAKIVSARFRDQPVPPLKKAVFWTEHLLKHPNDRRFHPAVLDLRWYQELLLDVIVFLLFAVTCIVYALYLLWKTVLRRLYRKVITKQKVQ